MHSTSLLNGNRHSSYSSSSLPQNDSQISIVPDQEPLHEDANPNLMAVIARAARDPSVNVEKMERLWAMHERMQDREAETAFNDAMMAAQSEMKAVRTDAENSQTHSKYATYTALDAALRPIYTGHGFAISFDTGETTRENHVLVLAYVSRGRYTRTYRAEMPADGKGARGGDVMTKTHATGSAYTYGQRYLLKGIFNIAMARDDDGNAAGNATASAAPNDVELEYVTADQIAALRAKIKEVGATETFFLRYIQMQCMENIFRNKFSAAMNVLDNLAKAKAGGK